MELAIVTCHTCNVIRLDATLVSAYLTTWKVLTGMG